MCGTRSRPTRCWRRTTGVPDIAEIAPGRHHSIPAVADCRDLPRLARTEILGFDALQLSDDRDPNAPHAEALTSDMVTLRTLVEEGRLQPSRTEWVAEPPRIAADDARTRAALGYLSANCGNCHNRQSSIASLGLNLKHSLKAKGECTPALATSVEPHRSLAGAGCARGRVEDHPRRPAGVERPGLAREVAPAFVADAAARHGGSRSRGGGSADGVGAGRSVDLGGTRGGVRKGWKLGLRTVDRATLD